MRTSTLVGARVPRARRHPTPTRGSVVGRPAAPRAGGGPPGTSAPTILPPAPTWPLPFSRPHPHRPLPFSHPHPHRPLPLSHPHPLGPYHSPTRTHLAPTLALQRPGARSPRAALGAGRPLSPTHASTPCASRAPRNSPPKKSDFFCHRRMPVAYIHVSGFARICAAPNKTRGNRRFGRRVRRMYFFSRPPCAHGGCVVYSWRL